MKKPFLILTLLLSAATLFSQRYKTTESFVRFYSKAPLEDIEATTEASSSIVDIEKMTIAIVVPIKTFDFDKKLMEEHFNENYLESDEFPNAVFKGKITGWDGSDAEGEATAVGTMEMHGVTQEVEITGQLKKEKKELTLETKFMLRLEDYDIAIPKAVFYKIAEEVEVTANFVYKPYEKN